MKLKMRMMKIWIQEDRKMELDLINHWVKNYMVIKKVFDPKKIRKNEILFEIYEELITIFAAAAAAIAAAICCF
jgi:hypothetical protein